MSLKWNGHSPNKIFDKTAFLVDIHNICVYIIIIDDGVKKKKVSKNTRFIENFLTLNIYYNRWPIMVIDRYLTNQWL